MKISTPLTRGITHCVHDTLDINILKTSHRNHQRISPHAHEHPAITFVVRGEFEEIVNSQKYVCDHSTLLFKPGGSEHSNIYGPNGSTSIIISFKNTADLLPDGIPLPTKSLSLKSIGVRNMTQTLVHELEKMDSAAVLNVHAIILQSLAELIRSQQQTGKGKNSPPDWLLTAVDFLSEKYREKITLKQVADHCGVHPMHLASEMKRFFGVSVGNFIRQQRLQKSRELLAESQEQITTIALSVGFSDSSHFCRTFKSYFGLTPSEFRQQRRRPN